MEKEVVIKLKEEIKNEKHEIEQDDAFGHGLEIAND
jgi:hypothetical protein